MHAQKGNPAACGASGVSNDRMVSQIDRHTRRGARRILSTRNSPFRKRERYFGGSGRAVVPVVHRGATS